MFTDYTDTIDGLVVMPRSGSATIYTILDNGTITGQYQTSKMQTLTGDYIYIDDDHIYCKTNNGYYVMRTMNGSEWVASEGNSTIEKKDNKIMWLLFGIMIAATIYLITKNNESVISASI